MIGVFDSGLGGVQSAKYIAEMLPAYDLFILSDSKFSPYGEKDYTWIKERTFTCLHWMFSQGCSLVIMACNTASTIAIVEWQEKYPTKKVLSVTIPGIEEVVERGYHHIGVLATKTTIETNLYPHMFVKHFPNFNIFIEQVIGKGLVMAIESMDIEKISKLTKKACDKFSSDIEAVVLGCTHYPIIQDWIKKDLPKKVDLIDPGYIAAERLVIYLQKHKHLALYCKRCTSGGTHFFNTTGDQKIFTKFCGSLWGKRVKTKQIFI